MLDRNRSDSVRPVTGSSDVPHRGRLAWVKGSCVAVERVRHDVGRTCRAKVDEIQACIGRETSRIEAGTKIFNTIPSPVIQIAEVVGLVRNKCASLVDQVGRGGTLRLGPEPVQVLVWQAGHLDSTARPVSGTVIVLAGRSNLVSAVSRRQTITGLIPVPSH